MYRMLGANFPYGTLAVNVSGSFLVGLLAVMLLERVSVGVEMRSILIIGFPGAFTTFSSFSYETLLLFQQGNH